MKIITQNAVVSLLVKDQDEALHFYTGKLGFEKRTDVTFGPGLRWLTVAAKGQRKPEIALAKPDVLRHGEARVQELMGSIGRSAPCLLVTDDCRKTYETLLGQGVKFASAPTTQLYGVEAVFEDPYGNTFLLLEATPEIRSLFENKSMGTAA